jgi:HSP20 family protein
MTNEQTPAPETTKSVTTRPRVAIPDIRDEFDRLWDFMTPWRPFGVFSRGQAVTIPPLDVFEKDGQLHVRAELPGIAQGDVDVSIEGDTLTISGEKHEEKEVKEEHYYRSERSYGKFSRQVTLPQGANPDQAVARFNNGVLEIDMPVNKVEAARKIEIKSGG